MKTQINQEFALANRLKKRQRHLGKWARRNGITCYRLYERDIPEFPLILDWYDGEAVVWLYRRTRDETDRDVQIWQRQTLIEIYDGLDLMPEQLFVKERQRQVGSGQYERMDQKDHARIIEEQGIKFEINLSDYLDTGLFLDHRNTRAQVRDLAKNKRVLNLFAYTGSFTCYAIAGGARSTTTVDLNPTYCEWTKRNLRHNGFREGKKNRVIQADCQAFLREELDQGAGYDIIICDPPTFSNSKRMNSSLFDIDLDHPALLYDCMDLLNDNGTIFFSSNARGFKLNEQQLPPELAIQELTPQSLPEDFRNQRIHRCWKMTG